jgi:ferredoxin
MKVFYFSGTGNSFYVAKKIAAANPQSEIISIPSFLKEDKKRLENDEIVIVSPLYFYGIAPVVLRFLEELEFENIQYFSAIFTAEFPNGLAINELKKICRQKGMPLHSCAYIKMPTNYVIKSKMPVPASVEPALTRADQKIEKLAGIIKNRGTYLERDLRIYAFITGAEKYHRQWQLDFPQFDSKFLCTAACTACKLCEKNCPVGNITVTQQAHWEGHCAACLRCINICPQKAIQYARATEDKGRYFNPRIRIKELS